MSLNIKSDEAHRLIRELAELRGVTMTRAVTDAVRQQLEMEKAGRSKRGSLAEELMEIGRRCAERMDPSVRSTDHGDYLYDERGLPK